MAVQTSGTFGHVAFITGVSGSTITIAEYNYGENGTYDTRSGTLSGLGFNKVTHFEKYESGGGQGGGEEVVPVATSDGHVQIFYDGNGTLGENWYSPGNGSSGGGTTNPGIQVEGNPTLVPRSGQSVIDAFIRGTSGQIFETWYNWGNGVWVGGSPSGAIPSLAIPRQSLLRTATTKFSPRQRHVGGELVLTGRRRRGRLGARLTPDRFGLGRGHASASRRLSSIR